MQLNIIIDDQLMQQARLITDLQSEQEIVEIALKNWIRSQKQPQSPKNPAQALLDSGFVGCGEAEPTLSTNYKQAFADIMEEKYADR